MLREQGRMFAARFDDREAAAVIGDVPFDQRQRTPTDRAEADHHQRSVQACVQGMGHQYFFAFELIQSIAASNTPETTKVR